MVRIGEGSVEVLIVQLLGFGSSSRLSRMRGLQRRVGDMAPRETEGCGQRPGRGPGLWCKDAWRVVVICR